MWLSEFFRDAKGSFIAHKAGGIYNFLCYFYSWRAQRNKTQMVQHFFQKPTLVYRKKIEGNKTHRFFSSNNSNPKIWGLGSSIFSWLLKQLFQSFPTLSLDLSFPLSHELTFWFFIFGILRELIIILCSGMVSIPWSCQNKQTLKATGAELLGMYL